MLWNILCISWRYHLIPSDKILCTICFLLSKALNLYHIIHFALIIWLVPFYSYWLVPYYPYCPDLLIGIILFLLYESFYLYKSIPIILNHSMVLFYSYFLNNSLVLLSESFDYYPYCLIHLIVNILSLLFWIIRLKPYFYYCPNNLTGIILSLLAG